MRLPSVGRVTTHPLIWPRESGPLSLRPPTEADLEQALTWRNRPEVTRWLLLTTVDPDAYTRNWLAEDADSVGVAAHVDGQLVGTGSLNVSDAMGQVHEGESIWRRAQGSLGYTIDPAHAGRGYGTHLARALLSIAFDELGLHRVTAGCFADNTPSWRVMERIGMRREQHGNRILAEGSRFFEFVDLNDELGIRHGQCGQLRRNSGR